MTELNETNFLYYSLIGGIYSSVGSLFGRLSRSLDVSLSIKGVLFLLMITFNTIGMTNFSKSLSVSSSSLKAMLVHSASNYFVTALIGLLLLGEETPFLWWCGTTFILCGLFIISYQQLTTKGPTNWLLLSSSFFYQFRRGTQQISSWLTFGMFVRLFGTVLQSLFDAHNPTHQLQRKSFNCR